MSILLKRKEYLEKIENVYPLKNSQKNSTTFNNKNFHNASFHHYRTNFGISYIFFKSLFKKNVSLESKHEYNDISFIMFNYSSNISKIQEYSKKSEFILKPQHYVVGKIDKNFKSFNLYLANKQYYTHYILFENEIFDELLSKDFLKKDLYNTKGFCIKIENILNLKQKLILEDLPTLFSLEGKLQELYLESKIIDLIYTTLNNIKRITLKDDYEFNSHDIKCLYKAKDILIENISSPPSLKILAHQSAINEFKLKKGFKKLFGNTVFGFLQEYRLNEAKKILMNNEININEVSYIVGYKNVSHFSKIFKEHFGVNPIQIKKSQKKVYI